MDSIIQMLPASLRQFSTYIDFAGQQKAERIFQIVLIVHGIVGFIAGYVTQQLSITMYSICLGFVISCIITLPPWPMFRRHPLNWQPNVKEEEQIEQKPVLNQKKMGQKKGETKKRR